MKARSILLGFSFVVGCAGEASTVPPAVPPSTPITTAIAPPPEPRRAETPDAPFRSSAPEASAFSPFVPPTIQTLRLTNGVRVLLLEQHLPAMLSVELVVKTQPAPLGANGMVSDAVWLGTLHTSQQELYKRRDADLAQTRTWSTPAHVGLGISGLSSHADSMIALLGEVALEPKMDGASILRLASNTFHERERQDDVPQTVAARIMPMALYGWDRPEDLFGTLRAADVGALVKDDVVHAYEAAFDPAGATLVVVGDTTAAALLPSLNRAFGSWKGHAKQAKTTAPTPHPAKLAKNTPRLVVVDRPHSPESYVLIEGAGPGRESPDWAPTLLLSSIFGGTGGRVETALASERHLVSSSGSVVPQFGLSTYQWHGELPTNQTGEGLRELDHQMRRLRETDVDEAEMALKRDRAVLIAPIWLDSMLSETTRLEVLAANGLSPDFVTGMPARMRAVTPADIRRVATSYLDPDHMKIVVVGDWSALRTQLLDLGWGAVEVRNASGTVLSVEPAAPAR